MRADVHMHTNFSHDSKSTPEEMILGAIAKGLQAVRITTTKMILHGDRKKCLSRKNILK